MDWPIKQIQDWLPVLVLCWAPQGTFGQAQSLKDKGMWVEEGYRFRVTNLVVPATLITVGTIGTAVKGWNDFGLFERSTTVKVGNGKLWADWVASYAEYPAFGWVFVCDLIGREQHHWKDQVMLTLLSEMLNGAIVTGLKYGLNKERPKGTTYSFPSGHTANAFLGAHVAFKEIKNYSPWLAGVGYAMAIAVGASRVYDNWHWLADVAAGAGIGILSVELAYLLYFPRYKFSIANQTPPSPINLSVKESSQPTIREKPHKELLLFPSFYQGHFGCSLAYFF
jgi:membrane-associated phospholipid phosphatase